MAKLDKAISYDGIALAPRVESKIEHRADCSTAVKCFGTILRIPLIASPMPDVCDGEMARNLAELGAMGIIHRFQTIEEQVVEYKKVISELDNSNSYMLHDYCGCAIGASGDYKERLDALYKAGCRTFCIDTANGFHVSVKKAVEWIRQYQFTPDLKLLNAKQRGHTLVDFRGTDKIYIIAGNVSTAEGYRYLAQLGVDAVRVGIAGGSACITKTETGVYYPMVTSIAECVRERNTIAFQRAYNELLKSDVTLIEMRNNIVTGINATTWTKIERYVKNNVEFSIALSDAPLIIADGGIKTPADVAKALAIGADIIMAGGIFAGTKESPGDIIKDKEGRLYKIFRGAASFGVQKEAKGSEPAYNEGAEMFVPYKGEVSKVVKRFHAGLQSSMSYMNANNLNEFKVNVDIIYV